MTNDLEPGERLLLDGGGWVLRDPVSMRFVLFDRNGNPKLQAATLQAALDAAAGVRSEELEH